MPVCVVRSWQPGRLLLVPQLRHERPAQRVQHGPPHTGGAATRRIALSSSSNAPQAASWSAADGAHRVPRREDGRHGAHHAAERLLVEESEAAVDAAAQLHRQGRARVLLCALPGRLPWLLRRRLRRRNAVASARHRARVSRRVACLLERARAEAAAAAPHVPPARLGTRNLLLPRAC